MKKICALALAALACAAPPSRAATPDDWLLLSAGSKFTLRAPAGTTHHPLQGEDSYIGEFVNPRFRIGFDYGRWSNNLAGMETDPRYKVERISVDGRSALLGWGPGDGEGSWGCADNLVAMYVAEVEPGGSAKLEIDGCTSDPATVPVLIEIFKSIRFSRG